MSTSFVPYGNADHRVELLLLSGRHPAVGRGQHDHPTRTCWQVRGAGQHHRHCTAHLRELTEYEHNTSLAESRVQSLAAEGALLRPLTLPGKTLA